MAQRTGLEEGLLTVERRRARCVTSFSVGSGIRVALQAEQIDVAHPQHVDIGSTMRKMTGRASLDFYRFMLEDKWSLLIGVTIEANGVLCRRGAYLLWPDGAVGIVAIGALHQAFVYAVVKRHFKFGFPLQMTRVTKLGLGFRQKKFFGFRVVWRMAGDTTHIILRMNRVNGVHVLRAPGMAGQAARIDFLGRGILEGEDFGYVATTRHVVGTGAVATFAPLMRRSTFGIESSLPVRSFLPAIVDLLVAGLAGLRTHIKGRVRRPFVRFGLAC